MNRVFIWIAAMMVATMVYGQSEPPGAGGLRVLRQGKSFRLEQPASKPDKPKSVDPPAAARDEKPEAQATPPASDTPREVDSAEVTRRGDRVTRAGAGPMGVSEQLLSDATSPPPDDSHKWFFSIIVDDGTESQALLYDLKHSPHLRAWMNLDEPRESWSHCTLYKKGDATQDWRWQGLTFSGYPVMILQPPAKLRDENQPTSWEWGDPKMVVWQWDRYDVTRPNRAQLRSDSIRIVLKAYLEKLSAQPQFMRAYASNRPEAPPATTGPRQSDGPKQDNIGVNPPFTLPQTPTIPGQPVFPVFPTDPTQVVGPRAPTTPAPEPNALALLLQILMGTGSSMGFQNILLLVLIGIQSWRAVADKLHLKTLLSDQAFGAITSILESLTKNPPTTTTNTSGGQS